MNHPENLDCMADDQLMQFWQSHRHERGPARDLARYAQAAFVARSLHRAGHSEEAAKEARCAQRIYDTLPEALRW